MNNFFLLISLILGCYTISFSQEPIKKFEMHYYVGPTINNVIKTDYGNTGITEKIKNSVGFNLGIMPYWKFSKFLNLRFGLGYNFRNFKFEIDGFTFYNANGFVSAKSINQIILNELQIPLHIVIKPSDKNLYGFIGTDVNYSFNCNSKSLLIYSDGTDNYSNRKLDQQFNPTLEFGVGNRFIIRQKFSLKFEAYFSLLSKNIANHNKSGQSLGVKLLFSFPKILDTTYTKRFYYWL